MSTTAPALAVDVWDWFQPVTTFMTFMPTCSIRAHQSLLLSLPRRHSRRRRHLLGFVAAVVNTAEVASEVIIAVDGRLPHYGRVHCSHGKAGACPTRRVSTSAVAAGTMDSLCESSRQK